jgi:hypothetical protein
LKYTRDANIRVFTPKGLNLKAQGRRFGRTLGKGSKRRSTPKGFNRRLFDSLNHVEQLRDYIAKQEEHHWSTTFHDGFRRLVEKYGLEWNERYEWE